MGIQCSQVKVKWTAWKLKTGFKLWQIFENFAKFFKKKGQFTLKLAKLESIVMDHHL
jgi:hypothetical protein